MPSQADAFGASAPRRQPDRKRDDPSTPHPPLHDPDNPRPHREESGPDSPRRPEDIPGQKVKQNQTGYEKPHINAPADNPAWSQRVGENPEEAGQEERERKSGQSAQKKIENEHYRDDKRR